MAKPPPNPWHPATPLFYLHEGEGGAYTIEDSFTHNLVLGQTGSGKSSTTSRVLLSSMARHGYGGLLTCCKRTDAAEYLRILTQCGRA